MPRFGDYVVYVDESGDHSMVDIDPQYPRFVLAFCVFPVEEYITVVVPAVERLKFDFFGHDMVILHEREIRKAVKPFDILLDARVRGPFIERMNELISKPRFGIVATVIRKQEFKDRVGADVSPYNVALEYGLERVFLQLQMRGQVGKMTSVIFEGRGKREDAALELEFRRIMDTTRMRGMAQTLRFECVSKKANSSGLQLADMVARPIGLKDLRPAQSNRAWDVVATKMVRSTRGQLNGYGLKIYP